MRVDFGVAGSKLSSKETTSPPTPAIFFATAMGVLVLEWGAADIFAAGSEEIDSLFCKGAGESKDIIQSLGIKGSNSDNWA